MTTRDLVRNPAAASALGLLAVAVLTAVLLQLAPHVEVLLFVVCYQLIVLVVSGTSGTVPGLATGLGSVLAFNWFFLPPVHTLTVADSRNWISLAVFAATALITSQLAAGSRRQRDEAEARRRDAMAIAEIARSALVDIRADGGHADLAAAAASALGVPACRIALEPEAAEAARRQGVRGDAQPSGTSIPLVVRGRPIGLLELDADAGGAPDRSRGPGFASAVGGIVALAMERSRLLDQVLEVESLRRSDELKTSLLRTVSHEFRTPLTAMRTAGEALAQDPAPGDAAALIVVLTEETERLERLVGNLLDLSRMEAGGVTTRMEWCDPLEIMSGAVAVAGPLLGGRPVAVREPGDLPLVRADAVFCERILVNLLHNAARHGAPPFIADLRVSGDRIEFGVEDAGAGPDPALAPRLFSAFAAGGPTGGTGVGLALSRGFAEAQGGDVRLERVASRTRVTLSLPLEPVPEVV